jgi:hypothetical protein
LGVDGAHTAEVLVVLGDFEEALTGNVSPTGRVFQERQDIVHSFGATKREDEKRVVRARGIIE